MLSFSSFKLNPFYRINKYYQKYKQIYIKEEDESGIDEQDGASISESDPEPTP